jgi:enamine deaminase RidA (YjgF/YER057c/UK114 family)
MALHHINPAGLPKPSGYTQVVIADGKRIVAVAGQVGVDAQGVIVRAGDLEAQATQALQNLKIALTAAGAGLADIIAVTVYIVNFKPADRQVLNKVRAKFFQDLPLPASTLLGVQALAAEEYLFEIEAIAVVA